MTRAYHARMLKVLPAAPSSIADDIWRAKYRFAGEAILADSLRRVARAVAAAERPALQAVWEERFVDLLRDLAFIPAGRILAGAGTGRDVTLFNCFVMGRISDSIVGIFDNLTEAAQTLQQGGGIGHDFSTLRPKGALVKGVGAEASGPTSFMDVWDAMCRTIMSAGARRGAMMATLACDHPDIEDFIAAKRDPRRLRNFNVSVLVSDTFMQAVHDDAEWSLVFEGVTYKELKARDLWQQIMQATYDYAEPGVIFIDRVNHQNPLSYCETISATNPCGEQPLPPYGACLLGSMNLTRYVRNEFSPAALLDADALTADVKLAVRFLDNVIDVSRYPLPQQEAEAKAKRRLGLGVTGLADALLMCGLRYGSEIAATTARNWMQTIQAAALEASCALAIEKGSFPLFDSDAYLATPYATNLSEEQRGMIATQGLRNGLLTSIAPTGTISLLAGNVSSGIEPVFAWNYERTILEADGSRRVASMTDYALARWRERGERAMPPAAVTAATLAPSEHLVMQAAAQAHVDSSISKTINVPVDMPFEDFVGVYEMAYRLGLKGCTTFRPNAVTGSILAAHNDETCPSCGSSDLVAKEACTTCQTCGTAFCG